MSVTSDGEASPIGGGQARQVEVDLDLCKVCGICSSLCPENVFDRDERGYPVVARPDDCTACLLCELHCPDFAIEVRRRAGKRPAKPAAGGAPADADQDDVPAVTREDLVAATSGSAAEHAEPCGHDHEDG